MPQNTFPAFRAWLARDTDEMAKTRLRYVWKKDPARLQRQLRGMRRGKRGMMARKRWADPAVDPKPIVFKRGRDRGSELRCRCGRVAAHGKAGWCLFHDAEWERHRTEVQKRRRAED